jgi:hypothetical protein
VRQILTVDRHGGVISAQVARLCSPRPTTIRPARSRPGYSADRSEGQLAVRAANGTLPPMHHHETGDSRLNATMPQDTPFASFKCRGDQFLPSFDIFIEACFQFLHFSTWHGNDSELAPICLNSAHGWTACDKDTLVTSEWLPIRSDCNHTTATTNS